MKCYITSSPTSTTSTKFNEANGFVELLKKDLKRKDLKVLYICSDPNLYEITDYYANITKESLLLAGFELSYYLVLDNRLDINLDEYIKELDLIILAGGHVLIQNDYFKKIHLKEALRNYNGVIIGNSAGSMNMAHKVYVHFENEEEYKDKNHILFCDGLGLTNYNILPHYNEVSERLICNKDPYKDLALRDSLNERFYVLNDGSFIYLDDDLEYLYGEAYLVSDNKFKKINNDNEYKILGHRYKN